MRRKLGALKVLGGTSRLAEVEEKGREQVREVQGAVSPGNNNCQTRRYE